MLTSVVTSSFPSLIILSLCEKHEKAQTNQMMGRRGLQARGEIRKHFGKHFSKHWLKLWGSGFLHILEWRIHSDEVCYMISHFLHTPYPSPILESCGAFWSTHLELWLYKQVPGMCQAALLPLMFARPLCSLCPFPLLGIAQAQLWQGDVLGDLSWVALDPGHLSHLQIPFQFSFGGFLSATRFDIFISKRD